MPDASYLQTSFLGGEWSPYAQGRMEDPRYRTGLNVCRNGLPVEEGAWTRRPGVRLAAATRSGKKAVLRTFHFNQAHPYTVELTGGHMRFFSGPALAVEASVFDVNAVSAADPAVITTQQAHGYATGDQVIFRWVGRGSEPVNAGINPLLGREFSVTVIDTTNFSVTDALTGVGLDGSTVTLGTSSVTVQRILDVVTPWQEADLDAVNKVQDQTTMVLLHSKYAPRTLETTNAETNTTSGFATFSFGSAVFTDGPYLDPVTDGAAITPSGTSGSITLTISGGTTRWATTDVGRLVRLFSEPATWASGTAYVKGDKVAYNGAYYAALSASTGVNPEQDPSVWAVDTTAAAWTWALITAYTSSTVVTATIKGDALLRTTPNIATWRLGLYSDTTGYPTCGVYHEGRLWLAGVVGNRIDGSKSNDLFNFAPTYADGTVADDSACSYSFRSTDVNQVFWMVADNKGVVCGTQAGEWIVQASQLNDPLTPTSVQAHRYTDYGCANIPAERAGLTIAFVQRFRKKLMEYLTTDWRGFTARNLSVTGKHLTGKKIAEIAYQRELVPCLWARTDDGSLIGCTYKRENPFADAPPDFAGWHRHDLGNGHTVTSIQTGPSFNGDLDTLSMVTKDTVTGYYYTQLLTDVFDTTNALTDANFVDMGVGPQMAQVVTVSGTSYIRLYGLWRLEGKTVSVFLGGIDCGDFTVTGGIVSVPIDTLSPALLTTAWLNSLTSTTNYAGLGVAIRRTDNGEANLMTVAGLGNITPPTGQVLTWTFLRGRSAIDWANSRMYTVDIATGGMRGINLDTLAMTTEQPWTSPPYDAGFICDKAGRIIGAAAATNAAVLYRIPTTLIQANAKTFGVASSAFVTDATHYAFPISKTAVQTSDGRNYLVSSSKLIAEVAVMDLDFAADGVTDGCSWTGFSFAPTEGDASLVCAGKPAGTAATAYVVARLNGTNGADGPSNTPLGIYRVVIHGPAASDITYEKLGTLTVPQLFGAGDWTHYDNIKGVIADLTEGHEGIILEMYYLNAPAWSNTTTYNTVGEVRSYSGHDYANLQTGNTGNQPNISPTWWSDLGVSHAGLDASGAEEKFVKVEIKGSSLNVVWNTRVFGWSANAKDVNQTRVRYGRLSYLGVVAVGGGSTAERLFDIETVAGTVTTRDVEFGAGGNVDDQFYDDYTGRLILDCEWSGHTGTPSPGSTSPVATGSLTSWTSAFQYALFTNATAPLQPPANPPTLATSWTTPVALGFTYVSQGQILRPIAPQEAGAANGPALAKSRRTHMLGGILDRAQGVKFGTDFANTRTAIFETPGGTAYALTSLFSGVYWDTLEDNYTFDSMVCWEIDRPYPAAVLSVGPFLHTQDR